MDPAHTTAPGGAAPARAARTVASRRPVAVAGLLLANLAGGAALLAGLAAAYKVKRRLGIDVFPGRGVLPESRIEAAIDAVLRLLRR